MTSTYHPTKYDSAADEVIAILSDEAEGYGKKSSGNVDAPTGHYALVILDSTCDLDVQDTTGAYPPGDLAGETAREYGVTAADITGCFIVTSNDQGFVSVQRFETPGEAEAAYEVLEAAFDAWSDDNE